MWRSTAQQTGANTESSGSMRRWGNGDAPPPPPPSNGGGGPTYHQQSWRQPAAAPTPETVAPPPMPASIAASIAANVKKEPAAAANNAQDGPRKRKSRWGDEGGKIQMPGLPTAIAGAVSGRDLENYSRSLRLEEITRKLRMNDIIPPDGQRSPSPEPAYDSHGRRTNTRDLRYKKKLEDERHILIEQAMANDPSFRPPPEFMQRQRGGRCQDKVYIPVKEFPEINFFGLLVGPRGNSLKNMERQSGAKISIRGKGSVKEGKQRPDGFQDDENEELHCLIMGDSEDKVRKCIQLIQNVIETAASTPESANDHKRNQLRELALLNGTLRDDEGQACQNCGQIGHRKYDCPEQRNFTANIICRTCGNAGHMARDCMQRRMPPGFQGQPGPPQQVGPNQMQSAAFDSEFDSLLNEIGEKPTSALAAAPAAPLTLEALIAAAPWRNPANWHPPQAPREQRGNDYGYQGGGGYQRAY